VEYKLSIKELQKLLKDGVNPYISFKDAKDVFVHLVEEVGELGRAMRKENDKTRVEEELGDVQILLCFMALSVDVDLEDATIRKIIKNIRDEKFRFGSG